jgi:putative endonuclease
MDSDIGYVYILKSISKLKYYIGSCVNIEKRFNQHNSGLVLSTKGMRPLSLEFYHQYPTIKEARRIEYRLKKLKSRIIIEQIIRDKTIKMQI